MSGKGQASVPAAGAPAVMHPLSSRPVALFDGGGSSAFTGGRPHTNVTPSPASAQAELLGHAFADELQVSVQ